MRTLSLNLIGLIEYIKSHQFYCFGAGNQGKRWAFFFDDLNVSKNCKGYIENNKSLHGMNLHGYESSFPIMSLEDVINKEEAEICIFITSLHYEEMLNQIINLGVGKKITCISSCLVAEEQLNVSSYSGIVRETNEPVIPKVIHYAWFGSEMPDVLKRNIEGWHKMCPNYEIKKWDENNYNITNNRYMLEAYENKMWGFVPDYLRLDVVYKEGGFYLDTDIEIVKNLDDLRYQKSFGCSDCSFTFNLGGGFGAEAGFEMIRELRDYYDNIHFIGSNDEIDNTSCNTHQFHVIRKYGYKLNDTLQNINGMYIYPMIFQGANSYMKTKRVTENTYWIHYGNMSWM